MLGDLGKLVVAKGYKKLPKVQKIARSGHTGRRLQHQMWMGLLQTLLTFQVCEPTGVTYTVRREYYPHTSPAGKGAKWEWAGDGADPEWHIYDMEVQTVIEDAWTLGKQVRSLNVHF